MNSVANGSAKCPFYRWEKDLKIYCEGMIHGVDGSSVTTTVSFRHQAAKINYLEEHCYQYVEKCPVASLCYKKYD